jgi:hypothetical protein
MQDARRPTEKVLTGQHRVCGIACKGDPTVEIRPWRRLPIRQLSHKCWRILGNPLHGGFERLAVRLGILLEDFDRFRPVNLRGVAAPDPCDVEAPSR